MKLSIELEQEDDGRWIAEVMEISGVLVYGQTQVEAVSKAQALALQVLAEAFHDSEEVGSKTVARVAKRTGLEPGYVE